MTLRVGDQVSLVIPRGGKIKVVPCHRVTLPPLDFTGPADMRVLMSYTLFIILTVYCINIRGWYFIHSVVQT